MPNAGASRKSEVGAAFFALDSHVVLTEHGTLRSIRSPGELFAQFTPQPKELEVDVAARSFALVRKLDTEKPQGKVVALPTRADLTMPVQENLIVELYSK